MDFVQDLPMPAGGTADGGSAGAAGGHTQKRQVDADVLALLREWELEDESERLAENGVCKMKDFEFMKEEDVQKFGLRLTFCGLLQYVTGQKRGIHWWKNRKMAWTFKFVDAIDAPENNDRLATLILAEYKKKTKWNAEVAVAADVGIAADATTKAKFLDQLMNNGVREMSLNLELFEPETVYIIEDGGGTKFTVKPDFLDKVFVHSDEVSKKLGTKDALVVQTPWGAKIAQFTFIKPENAVGFISMLAGSGARMLLRQFGFL